MLPATTLNKPTRESFLNTADPNDTRRSETRILDEVPEPPFWGVREFTDFTLAHDSNQARGPPFTSPFTAASKAFTSSAIDSDLS